MGEEVVDVDEDTAEAMFRFREVVKDVLEEKFAVDDEDVIGSYA